MRDWSGISVYLKDESTHPTGSLKHRLARSLILYGICNGLIGRDTTLVEASSGSTAVSEAYFARLLNLRFIAVMTRGTSRKKVEAIESFGGTCHFVERAGEVYDAARRIAAETGGHYLDQFTFAERATDWRTKNVAESIFSQMQHEPDPVPEWVVMSAGTGGTSATIGRYIRYRNLATRLCVVDVGALGLLRLLQVWRPRSHGPTGFAHRRHRPAPGGALLRAGGGGPHGPRARRRLDRCHARSGRPALPRGRLDRSQLPRPVLDRLADDGGGAQGLTLVTLVCDRGDRYADTYYDGRLAQGKTASISRPMCPAIETFLDHGPLRGAARRYRLRVLMS